MAEIEDARARMPAEQRARLDAFLQKAETTPWEWYAEHLTTAAAAWQTVAAGMTEAFATNGPRDGDWNAYDVCNHMAQVLGETSDALSRVAVAKQGRIHAADHFLPEPPSFAGVSERIGKGWSDIQAAARTVAKQPDAGPAIQSALGPLTPRQVVGLTLRHFDEHTQQIAALRGGTLL